MSCDPCLLAATTSWLMFFGLVSGSACFGFGLCWMFATGGGD